MGREGLVTGSPSLSSFRQGCASPFYALEFVRVQMGVMGKQVLALCLTLEGAIQEARGSNIS